MTQELKLKLIELAERFETKAFLEKDPSQFMHNYNSITDIEIVAFLAANLAFGRRDQILSHISLILNEIKNEGSVPSDWILSQKYKSFFSHGTQSFYRMYTDDDMILFFDTIKMMLLKEKSIGEYVKKMYQGDRPLKNSTTKYLHQTISEIFPKECHLISHSKNAAAKKLNMLLRWLVRDSSPVDLGIWNWYSKKDLLMPLDTHVLQESVRFGIIKSEGSVPPAMLKTAITLTELMKEVFPDDPLRADFALFGSGVSKS